MRLAAVISGLTAVLVVSALAAITIGAADIALDEVRAVVADHLGRFVGLDRPSGLTLARDRIVWELRIPRVLGAGVVGAGLAVVGAVMQTLTRNPMADPYLLGVSSGATFGAVLVLVAGVATGVVALSVGAFLGAMGAFSLVLFIGGHAGRASPSTMVLAGIAVAQAINAAWWLIVFWVNDPHATHDVTFWLAGSLTIVRWPHVGIGAAVLAVCLLLIAASSRSLDALVFGDESAHSLGVDATRLRWLLFVVAAVLTGTLVAMSGAIGFVGLILPHMVRMVVGVGHRRVLPVVALVGAIMLIWVDTAARTLFAPRELPVGIFTAVIGVPVFVVLLRRSKVTA